MTAFKRQFDHTIQDAELGLARLQTQVDGLQAAIDKDEAHFRELHFFLYEELQLGRTEFNRLNGNIETIRRRMWRCGNELAIQEHKVYLIDLLIDLAVELYG
ncbi:hypothetical protein BDV95DRAFT_593243 [Massariosphaeria phaeospora]|uniref:Uncharacterized protein n=1 Tax=Massariosphaeria phaeospora TaxID=100035 RepID=A0A7C8MA09_9PLEO|nr:hypothetical protein BDV95DRAFT_593243 [Massariosphaeria phaeospora]